MIGQIAIRRQAGIAKVKQLSKKANGTSTHRVVASLRNDRLDDSVEQTVLNEDG